MALKRFVVPPMLAAIWWVETVPHPRRVSSLACRLSRGPMAWQLMRLGGRVRRAFFAGTFTRHNLPNPQELLEAMEASLADTLIQVDLTKLPMFQIAFRLPAFSILEKTEPGIVQHHEWPLPPPPDGMDWRYQ